MNRSGVLLLSSCVLLSLSNFCHAGEKVGDVINEAKQLYQQADKLQGAWLSTDALLKKAQQQLKSGNEKAALEIANKARFEAKRSLEQAQHQQNNWSEPAYLK